MIKSYVDYVSKNGFYFHHTINTDPNGYTSSLESHNKIEILYLISGIVDYHINGSVFRISPGDIIVVNVQELHALHVAKGVPYERIVLQISSGLIPSISNLDITYPFLNAYLYEHIIPKEIVSKTNLVKILKSIYPLAKKPTKYTDIKIIAKITDVIAEINQAVELLTTRDYHLIPQPKSTNKLIQDIIKYINKNLNKNYTIMEIARI
ncbi:MAG: AraC family ligand binding domain-containing protein, partial [Clostridia bacterium]|nr:AraC family ligand binding domain-containing protein [Clostridia bacterium]